MIFVTIDTPRSRLHRVNVPRRAAAQQQHQFQQEHALRGSWYGPCAIQMNRIQFRAIEISGISEFSPAAFS